MERLPIYLAPSFIRFGVTANQITFLSLLVGLSGCILMAWGGYVGRLVGIGLITLWQVLDCVDGHVARTSGTASHLGAFLDTCGAHIMYGAVFFGWGLGLAVHPDRTVIYIGEHLGSLEALRMSMIVAGAIGALAITLRALVVCRYQEVLQGCLGEMSGDSDSSGPGTSRIKMMYSWCHRNLLEFLGFFLPLLFLLSALELSSIMLVLFSLCWIGDMVLNIAIHAWKLTTLELRE